MAQVKTLLFLLLISVVSAGASFPRSRARTYVEASCRGTRYPALCVRTLSGFANSTMQNPQQLAKVALAVSLYKARRTKAYLVRVEKELRERKVSDYPAVRDCMGRIQDSIALMAESIRELRRMSAGNKAENAEDVTFHISNVETWLSGALTEASTCSGQFSGRRMAKVKATIKGKVVNVEQTTSNALALFHRFALRYRAANKP